MKLTYAEKNLEEYAKEILLLFLATNIVTKDEALIYHTIIEDSMEDRDKARLLTLRALDIITDSKWIFYDHPFGWKLHAANEFLFLYYIEEYFKSNLILEQTELAILSYIFNSTFRGEKVEFCYDDLINEERIGKFTNEDILNAVIKLKQKAYICEAKYVFRGTEYYRSKEIKEVPSIDYIENDFIFYLNEYNNLIKYSLYITDKTTIKEFMDKSVIPFWTVRGSDFGCGSIFYSVPNFKSRI